MTAAAPLLLLNANVITMDDDQPRAAAVLFRDSRVHSVGPSEQLRELAGEATVLDLDGATVVPGFVDAHTHYELTSVSLDQFVNAHTPPCKSLIDIAEVIRSELNRPVEYPWIVCRSSFGFQNRVVEGRLFTRAELDQLVADRPLVVFAGLHVAALNTAAMSAMGLLGEVPPPGVTVHRDTAGAPTGAVTEIFDLMPAWPPELVAAAVARHERDLLLANGVTSISSIPFAGSEMRAVRIAQRQGAFSVRVRHYPVYPWGADLDSFEQLGVDSELGDDRYRYGGVKVFVDGTGSDGLGTFVDDVKYTQAELDGIVGRADRLGLQVLMHAFTRRGIGMAARAAAAVRDAGARRDLRHRIEHGADHVNLEDLDLIRASGVSLVGTPHFMYSGGGELSPQAPFRSLIDTGFDLIGGTDTTGTVLESASPLFNIACAVTRRRHDGSCFRPDQAISVMEGLKMFTTWAAWGGFDEQVKGKLAPGFLGDAAILSRDPLGADVDDLTDIKVEGTVIAGELVYCV